MKIRLEGLSPERTLKRIVGNNTFGLQMANTVQKHMDKYVPADTLTLAQTVRAEPFKLTFTQPYANRVFNGDRFNFSTDVHPLATAHWDVATEQNQGKRIGVELTNYLKGL